MEFIVPNGSHFGFEISDLKIKPLTFQIDKSKVLISLAERARKAGAELNNNSRVIGLIREECWVIGV